jgi:crotonobetainyl-CoA:carnitine CoA-transferase CaiB-like acyl-CoA transferase
MAGHVKERNRMGPLEGIRVLDLTNVLAGPFCCHQLAHFGAEVIKVEMPGRGDLARQLGTDAGLNRNLMGVSYLAQNAGKKSITLNMKHAGGKALLKRLVANADVLVENFRPGVMDRLGLGWEVLRTDNPRLVYCAISGFGQDGPWKDRPAYDQIIQGVSGLMSITGDAGSAPLRVGYPVADTIGGITAAFAISAALNERKRGRFIDVSMLESVLATMGWAVSDWLIAGVRPGANGNENFTASPSSAFQCADGLLNISANKQEQWEAMCAVLGREDLAVHPDFLDREDRKTNRLRLKAEMETVLTSRPARHWDDALNAAGVPAGQVFTVPDILAHPQIAGRGMVAVFADAAGVGRDVSIVRTGAKLDGQAPAVSDPPPVLGQHNAEVYAALGLSEVEIAGLKDTGVI